jgi:hypothetical protein
VREKKYFLLMGSHPLYISASRRTDIPRFFVNDFFSAWRAGEISYDGGYGRSYSVSLKTQDVLGYIFWSKDFSPFISHPLFKKLIDSNNAVFHFTINDCPDLEPRLAPLQQRLETLVSLCKIVGAERVFWRFDPLCKYYISGDFLQTNEKAFFTLLPFMKTVGIESCYFSFMTFYQKFKTRDVKFLHFTIEEKLHISRRMLAACTEAGMTLFNCCNHEIIEMVPGIQAAHCIDENILRRTDRFGVHRSLFLKPTRKGCGCFESRDIGSYQWKCPHGCLYCYANPFQYH